MVFKSDQKNVAIHKKGSKIDNENYRPITNLFSIIKVFEQLIINHLRKIEKDNNCTFTGVEQHGFKKKRKHSWTNNTVSTNTHSE